MKRVYLVRHGEAEGNVTVCFQTPETPLTEIGHEQAKMAAERCKALDADLLIASSMKRAQQTAGYIATETGLEIETTDLNIERLQASSVWGKSRRDDAGQAYIRMIDENYPDPNWRFEDAETFSDVYSRLKNLFVYLEEKEEQKIILVGHGKFMKSMMAYVLHGRHLTPEIDIEFGRHIGYMGNAAISVLEEYEPKKWKLLTYNDIAHFAE